MKKLSILFGLTLVLLLTACKDNSVAQGIEVLTPQKFEEATAQKDIQLLDVRTAKEFKAGHLDKALNIDVLEDDFSKKVEALNPEKPVYLYCRSGNRSKKASSILTSLGFKEVYDLEGGFQRWESEGLQAKN